MSVINTNYLALVSQNNLTKSQGALGQAIERLSSGMRINSAKDDAAGQAIANRFTANVKGLTQAARNANDGISIAQTTEGSLNEINNNLQRIRELSVQAANGSNSESDLASIQNEIRERLDEIDRVSRETQFNGKYVLGADAESLSVQVGAHDNQRINIELSRIDSTTLGLKELNMNSQALSADLTETTDVVQGTPASTLELNLPTGTATPYTFYVGDDGELYAQGGAASGSNYYAASYDIENNSITVDVDSGTVAATTVGATSLVVDDAEGEPTVVEMSTITAAATAGNVEDGQDSSFTFHVQTSTGDYFLVNGDGDVFEATVNMSTGQVSQGTTSGVATSSLELASHYIDVPAEAGVAADMSTVNAALAGTNTLHTTEDGALYVKNVNEGKTTWYTAEGNETTGAITPGEEVVVDPLKAIDDALQQVDNLRSHLGAIQNRFESTIANLNNTVNNLSAARSRIEDADYAVEVSNMTRAQILQQAGTSVLAQANQVPQTVLSLLR